MKQYHHTKTQLARAVCRNESKLTKEPVYVQAGGVKSIPSMKYIDTTVLQVYKHSELPIPTATAIILHVFHKGRERKIF